MTIVNTSARQMASARSKPDKKPSFASFLRSEKIVPEFPGFVDPVRTFVRENLRGIILFCQVRIGVKNLTIFSEVEIRSK